MFFFILNVILPTYKYESMWLIRRYRNTFTKYLFLVCLRIVASNCQVSSKGHPNKFTVRERIENLLRISLEIIIFVLLWLLWSEVILFLNRGFMSHWWSEILVDFIDSCFTDKNGLF